MIIARGGRPAVRIVPVAHRPFLIEMLDGKGGALPDFLESMPADELSRWD